MAGPDFFSLRAVVERSGGDLNTSKCLSDLHRPRYISRILHPEMQLTQRMLFVSPCYTTTLKRDHFRRSLQSVTIHPVALFSILDHYLRRTDAQERVIGTLLGTRTETEIEVHGCFAVLHSETSEQVAVDMEYHRTMYELHHKVHPKETIVGWCVPSLCISL